MRHTHLLTALAVSIGMAACGSTVDDETGPSGTTTSDGGGTATSTGTNTGSTSGTTTTADGGSGGCPASLPAEGEPCGDGWQRCDYPDSGCVAGAVCMSSYEMDTYGEYVWSHVAPDDGAVCSSPGQLCRFSDALMDSEVHYEAALCTENGWITAGFTCGNGNCPDCPAALPAAGSPCDEGDGLQWGGYVYGICLYAVEQPCGHVLAYLECTDGAFVVHELGCE